MKKVIRFECEFCEKLFKTPDRHKCKYDPKFKNCYSCGHNEGWDENRDDEDYRHSGSIDVICKHGEHDAQELSNIKYDLQCRYHLCCGKWYNNGYAKRNIEKEWEGNNILNW